MKVRVAPVSVGFPREFFTPPPPGGSSARFPTMWDASAHGAAPWVVGVVGQAIGPELDLLLVAELLCRHVAVARVAQVARVVVLVCSAQRERLDVIDHSSERHPPARSAPFA